MRSVRRLPILACTCAIVLSATSACSSSAGSGGSGGGGGGGGYPTFHPVRNLTAAEFHAIGVAAQAPPLANGETPAQRLGVDADAVNGYATQLCDGRPALVLPTLSAFSNQVPAYEAIFTAVRDNCSGAAETALARQRGYVASSITRSQEFIDRLTHTPSSSVTSFCDRLDRSEDINSTVISTAAEKLGAGDTEVKLLEFGVKLLINNCTDLLGRVTG
jgi:hypothetical protein